MVIGVFEQGELAGKMVGDEAVVSIHMVENQRQSMCARGFISGRPSASRGEEARLLEIGRGERAALVTPPEYGGQVAEAGEVSQLTIPVDFALSIQGAKLAVDRVKLRLGVDALPLTRDLSTFHVQLMPQLVKLAVHVVFTYRRLQHGLLPAQLGGDPLAMSQGSKVPLVGSHRIPPLKILGK